MAEPIKGDGPKVGENREAWDVAMQFSTVTTAVVSQTVHALNFAIRGRDEAKEFDLGEKGVWLEWDEAKALVEALLPLILLRHLSGLAVAEASPWPEGILGP